MPTGIYERKPRSPEYCHNIAMAKMGAKHPRWKSGITLQKGYIVILQPEHPRANCIGYVKRARLVLEEKLGRHLLPKEDIHHINGIKTDDRPENLIALNHSEHTALHRRETK